MAFDDAIRKNGPDFRGPMFKQQIIDVAQAYCDCEMQPNFWAGTREAGWLSMDTLIKHNIISKLDNFRARASVGFNRGPQNEYTLSDLGVRFLAAMLEKYPRAGHQADPQGHRLHAQSPVGKRKAASPGSQGAKRAKPSPSPRVGGARPDDSLTPSQRAALAAEQRAALLTGRGRSSLAGPAARPSAAARCLADFLGTAPASAGAGARAEAGRVERCSKAGLQNWIEHGDFDHMVKVGDDEYQVYLRRPAAAAAGHAKPKAGHAHSPENRRKSRDIVLVSPDIVSVSDSFEEGPHGGAAARGLPSTVLLRCDAASAAALCQDGRVRDMERLDPDDYLVLLWSPSLPPSFPLSLPLFLPLRRRLVLSRQRREYERGVLAAINRCGMNPCGMSLPRSIVAV
jgi:hypothetical protein